MKAPLILFLSVFPFWAFSQMQFEVVQSPDDFSMVTIHKSPTAEYFTQPTNLSSCVYQSENGQDWVKSDLPEYHALIYMDFYSDGTPIMKERDEAHLIRREGTWYSMELPDTWGKISASFVRNDTLFVFQDNTFAYSTDKGATFEVDFVYDGEISDYHSYLWKFENYYVLSYQYGADYYLSVFDRNGDEVLRELLDTSTGLLREVYNDCGEVLLYSHDRYFLLREAGLTFESGDIAEIAPVDFFGRILSEGGDYYYFLPDYTVYKSTACNFDTWELWLDNDLITVTYLTRLDEDGNLYTNNYHSDHYNVYTSSSGLWEEKEVSIDYSMVYDIDEAASGRQVAVTPNTIFLSGTNIDTWSDGLSSEGINAEAQFSPNGNLYINNGTDIFLSEDDGNSFQPVAMPVIDVLDKPVKMHVLDDGIIFLVDNSDSRGYYSNDDGQNWHSINANDGFRGVQVKLVNNTILLFEVEHFVYATSIDLSTGTVASENLGGFNIDNFAEVSTIGDDGTIYFYGYDQMNSQEGLFQFKFGEGASFIGDFNGLHLADKIQVVGDEVYGFARHAYFVYDGSGFMQYGYSGLPTNGRLRFLISENSYVYVIQEDHQIFRSTVPLREVRTISGNMYLDANQDCQEGSMDSGLKYWQVRVEDGDYLRIKRTDANGYFNFTVPQEGTYTISSQPVSNSWELCDTTFSVQLDNGLAEVEQNFYAKGTDNCAHLELDFSTPFLRRCFENYYSVMVRNTGPEPSTGTLLTLELDTGFVFTSASIPVNQIDENTLEFELGSLGVNEEVFFQVQFTLSCEVFLGAEHCLVGTLTDKALCTEVISPIRECQTNIGAYDPNDKRVFNENGSEVSTLDKGAYLYYHIRFQNTGTDTAFNVKVADPLSPLLDLSSLQMLSASHPYEYVVTDGASLEVSFNNILLPDSTVNEPASHGYFKFRIKPLAEVEYGTTINNQAAIYFDFNDPIYTNQADVTIQPVVSSLKGQESFPVRIFPNPAGATLMLDIPEKHAVRVDAYEVYDFSGRLVHRTRHLSESSLDISKLLPGAYTLVLRQRGSMLTSIFFIKSNQ